MKRPILLALIATGAISLMATAAHPMMDYANNRGISRTRLRVLNWYSRQGQTSRDVRRLLRSAPNQVDRDYESYTIRETVDY